MAAPWLTRYVTVTACLAIFCLAGTSVQILRTGAAAPPATHFAAAACFFLLAGILKFEVPVGGERLMFSWSDTAFALALLLLPPLWVVAASTAGLAASYARLRPAIKPVYNTAAQTVAAALAVAAANAVRHQPIMANPPLSGRTLGGL